MNNNTPAVTPTFRYNRNSSYQAVELALGKHKYIPGRIVHFTERMSFGVTIIVAIARFGKSTIVKNLYTQIGQMRPVIILDYLGEHSNSKWPNFLSEDRNTRSLPELIELRGFKFKISQFNNVRDWLSLTFADRGALLMTDLARQANSHRDDPELFKEMLEDVPLVGNYKSIDYFKRKWGFELPQYNVAVVDSCKALYTYLLREGFFGKPDDPVYDFGKLAVKYRYLNINFGLDKADAHKARAIAGKVLEQIKRVIDQFEVPPLIVVEEADVIAPNANDTAFMVSSLVLLIEFVLKLQKKKIELMFIAQDLSNLHSSITGNTHTKILGQLPEGNEHHQVCLQLVWDIEKNYREFLIMRTGVPGYEVFIPEDSMTMY